MAKLTQSEAIHLIGLLTAPVYLDPERDLLRPMVQRQILETAYELSEIIDELKNRLAKIAFVTMRDSIVTEAKKLFKEFEATQYSVYPKVRIVKMIRTRLDCTLKFAVDCSNEIQDEVMNG